jgi:cytochrome b561
MSNQHPVLLRLLHWLTALMVTVLLVLGFWMTERAGANLWDELTNALYSWHKLIGFLVLLATGLRIFVKSLTQGPDYPKDFPASNLQLAKIVQRTLYLLLILVPLFGWAGVTAYPALITVGGFHLPALPGVPKDEPLAKQLFEIHGYLVLALIAVSLAHIGAGLNHLLIKKDNIFDRIWFRSK